MVPIQNKINRTYLIHTSVAAGTFWPIFSDIRDLRVVVFDHV